MDLGRTDLMIRSGLWRPILQRWVDAGSRRRDKSASGASLKLSAPSRLGDAHPHLGAKAGVVMEHRHRLGRRGTAVRILNAIALVRAGLYDRREKRFVSVERHVTAEVGLRGSGAGGGARGRGLIAAGGDVEAGGLSLMVQGGDNARCRPDQTRIGPCPAPSTITSPSSSPWAYIGHAPFMDDRAKARDRRSITSRSSSAASSPRRAGCRCRSATRRGSAIGSSNCSAGATGAALAFNLQPKHLALRRQPRRPLRHRDHAAAQGPGCLPAPGLRRRLGGGAQPRRSARHRRDRGGGRARLDLAHGARAGHATEAIYALNLENAVAADVFGSPAYVLDGEVFWGQDRLELLDDALTSGRAPYRPTA